MGLHVVTSQSLKRKISKQTLSNLKYALEKEDWKDVISEDEVNSAFKSFMSIFNYHFHINCPYVRVSSKRKGVKEKNWSADVKLYENMLGFL